MAQEKEKYRVLSDNGYVVTLVRINTQHPKQIGSELELADTKVVVSKEKVYEDLGEAVKEKEEPKVAKAPKSKKAK